MQQLRRMLLVLLLAFVALPGFAQVTNAYHFYDWQSVTGTGQVGPYIYQAYSTNLPPRVFTVSWSVSGTPPSACTLRVEGSDDGGVNWFGLDATAPAADPVPCTSSNMISIADRPTRLVRVNVVSYTAGDSTTKVIFHYTKGL
jgi:hypothetical protein